MKKEKTLFMNLTNEVFATVYSPTGNGVAHCCIHYADDEFGKNHTLSGSMFITTLLNRCDCPVYDITDCHPFLGLTPDNILQRGGRRIRA